MLAGNTETEEIQLKPLTPYFIAKQYNKEPAPTVLPQSQQRFQLPACLM
jgi:hypothetical protein